MRIPRRRSSLLALVLGLVPALPAAAAEAPATPPRPDVIFSCPSPQALAPVVDTRAGANDLDLAFDGTTVMAALQTGSNGRLVRLRPDGSVDATFTYQWQPYFVQPIRIVWDGSAFGVAYVSDQTGTQQVFFTRINRDGLTLMAPLQVTQLVAPNPVSISEFDLAVDSSGNFLVAWTDSRNGNADLFATRINSDGTLAFADILLVSSTANQSRPAAVYSPFNRSWLVFWIDDRSGTARDVRSTTILGSAPGSDNQVFRLASGLVAELTAATSNGAPLLAYRHSEIGVNLLYTRTLTSSGAALGPERQASSSPSTFFNPRLADNGYGWILSWRQTSGDGQIAAVDSFGLVGTPASFGFASALYGKAVAVRGGILVAGRTPASPNLYTQPFGCSAPVAPTCPGGLVAYSLSGSALTLGWMPAEPQGTEISHYEVFRNAVRVGTTATTAYNDSGLTAGATYAYDIRAVNAAAQTSPFCAASRLFVKSSAAVALAVAAVGNDISLSWTADAPQSGFRIFRGTSPQTMSQIGIVDGATTTALDGGALVGGTAYFYSVDEP